MAMGWDDPPRSAPSKAKFGSGTFRFWVGLGLWTWTWAGFQYWLPNQVLKFLFSIFTKTTQPSPLLSMEWTKTKSNNEWSNIHIHIGLSAPNQTQRDVLGCNLIFGFCLYGAYKTTDTIQLKGGWVTPKTEFYNLELHRICFKWGWVEN